MNLTPGRHASARWPTRLLLSLFAASLFLPPPARAAEGPDLSLTKTCVRDSATSVLCTVTITNIGAFPSAMQLELFENANASPGTTFVGQGGTLPGLGCTPGAGAVVPLTCHAFGSLQPNQTETATFAYNVPAGDPFANCVTVNQLPSAAFRRDPDTTNNTDICAELGNGGSGTGTGTGTGTDKRGSIRFMKKLLNDNPGVSVPASYTVAVDCNGMSSTVTLPASGAAQALAVPAGATCQWHEVAPPAPKGCAWTTRYPGGQVAHDGDTVRVENVLTCGGGNGNGGGDTATIHFVKRVLNDTPNKVTGPFEVEVKCNPSIQASSVMLSAPGFQQSIQVSPRAQCKFEEVTPVAPKGCHWVVSYPNGQTAKAGATVVIVNKLVCEGDGDGDGNGNGDDPKMCAAKGQALMRFPGSDKVYCCDGKPGSDKFCCTEVPRKIPMPMKRR